MHLHGQRVTLRSSGSGGALLGRGPSYGPPRTLAGGPHDAAPHAADLRVRGRALGAVAEHAHQRVPARLGVGFDLG